MVSDSDVKGTGPNPQRRRVRRRFYIVPLAIVLMAVLGVSLGGFTYCTLLTASSGVSFQLKSLLAHASGPLETYVCVASSCASLTVERCGANCISVRKRDGHLWVHVEGTWVLKVGNLAPTSPMPVTVRLKMNDQAGDPVFDSAAVVQLREWQPNGAFCPPTVYVGSVVATSDGRLVPQP